MRQDSLQDYWVAVATIAPLLLVAATGIIKKMAKRKNVGLRWPVWAGIGFTIVVLISIVIESVALLRLAGLATWPDQITAIPILLIVLSIAIIGAWGVAWFVRMFVIYFRGAPVEVTTQSQPDESSAAAWLDEESF